MEMMIFKIIYLIAWFALLYIVAFISNRHYRDSDDILFISGSQWEAIFLLMLPAVVALFMR
jgi:predicted secreted protein